LSTKFENLAVYVDGYTSEHDRPSPISVVEEDLEIFHKICDKVNKSVSMVSLIGATYVQKISYCNTVDAFLANGGNGSFVPLRICKKVGLIHSNSKFLSFPDFYGDNISYSIKPDIVASNFFELIWKIFSIDLRGAQVCKQSS
jgi:hypothetical protein